MISHVHNNMFDSKYPSSLSKEVVTNCLRNDLNFKGVIICDDPSMKAISNHYELEEMFALMINAGIDLFCLGNNLDYDINYIPKAIKAIYRLIENDKISIDRLNHSIERINNLKKKLNLNE